MKVARKERNESENQLLARYTEQRERILEEASHLAGRKLGLDDKAYLDDPIFRNIERASNPGKKDPMVSRPRQDAVLGTRRAKLKAKTETVTALRFDRRIWTGSRPSSFIVYALDVGHLALAPERVPEYEKIALFKERARAILQNGNFAVEVPARVYEFYHLDESDYTVMASEKKPKTIEVAL